MFGIFGRGKKIQANAAALLSEIPKGSFGILLLVYAAYKVEKPTDANSRVSRHPEETKQLLRLLDRPRDPLSSAGERGDGANLARWLRLLADAGYEEDAARIIAYVYQHDLEKHLDRVSSEMQARISK